MSTREVIIVGFGLTFSAEEAHKRWPELEDCNHPMQGWVNSHKQPIVIVGNGESDYFVGKVFKYADLYNSDSLILGKLPSIGEVVMDENFVAGYIELGIDPEQMINEGRYYANTHCF